MVTLPLGLAHQHGRVTGARALAADAPYARLRPRATLLVWRGVRRSREREHAREFRWDDRGADAPAWSIHGGWTRERAIGGVPEGTADGRAYHVPG